MRTSFLAVLLATVVAAGGDWPRFRGPVAQGRTADSGLPQQWDANAGVAWKTALPGPGASSPIVVGGVVYLTCYSGYGLDADAPGARGDLRVHLVAVREKDGKLLWDRSHPARGPEQAYRGFIALHGYGSSTPVANQERVFAFHGRTGVFAYTHAGEPAWQASVGDGIHQWGSAASPVLAGDVLVINASVESESLVGLDQKSGKELWRVGGIRRSWGTPVVLEAAGRQELVVSFEGRVLGLDPASGKTLWQCEGVADYICPSVIAESGVVYVTAGRKGKTLAIRAGGSGDVSKTHVLWTLNDSPKVGTPLVLDGRLYWVGHGGAAACVNAADGKVISQEKLDAKGTGDKFYASLVAGDGRLYAVSRQDGVFVLAAGPQMTELAHNHLGDPSVFNATPAISAGRLVLRSDKFLYAIGK